MKIYKIPLDFTKRKGKQKSWWSFTHNYISNEGKNYKYTGSTRSSGADFIAFIEQQAKRIGKNFNHSILAPHIDYCLGLVLFSLVTFLPG